MMQEKTPHWWDGFYWGLVVMAVAALFVAIAATH
jgi:hypothetical protein